ncbi:MAG TPA: HAD family hydrolase, partial [Pyrinomonadaceae bacterium]
MKKRPTINLDSVKLISWDVDGTLYSLRQLRFQILMRFLHKCLAGHGKQAQRDLASLAEYRRTMDRLRRDGGRIPGPLQDDDRRSLHKTEQLWYGCEIERIGPRTGAQELLTKLSAITTQVALSDYRATYKLEALGLKESFAAVYAGEEVGFLKPNP